MNDKNTNTITAQGAGNEEEKVISMLFPTSLVNQLERLFEGDKIDFNKVLFTTFWINKGKWNSIKNRNETYQEVSSRFPNWLALTGKKGTDFIKKLIDGGIIKKTTGYTTGKNYTRYALVTPFIPKGNAKGDDYTLYTLTPESGAYAKKYINDGYNVFITTSKKVKEEIEVSQPIEINEEVDTINYKEIINKMKEEIKTLQADLDAVNERVTEIELREPTTAIEAEVYEIMAKHLTNEISFINKVDELMNKNILDDDLDNYTGIESLVEAFAMQEEQEAKEKAEFIQKQQEQVETNIFDLKKYKNNLSAEVTEGVTNVIYRYTKSKANSDKMIRLLNEGKTIEKSDLMSFGVSGAIVNMMYNDLQKVI
nr:hypothetical protein [uncultured Sphingobacterium sp.]